MFCCKKILFSIVSGFVVVSVFFVFIQCSMTIVFFAFDSFCLVFSSRLFVCSVFLFSLLFFCFILPVVIEIYLIDVLNV